jgi:hypothetical protein
MIADFFFIHNRFYDVGAMEKWTLERKIAPPVKGIFVRKMTQEYLYIQHNNYYNQSYRKRYHID